MLALDTQLLSEAKVRGSCRLLANKAVGHAGRNTLSPPVLPVRFLITPPLPLLVEALAPRQGSNIHSGGKRKAMQQPREAHEGKGGPGGARQGPFLIATYQFGTGTTMQVGATVLPASGLKCCPYSCSRHFCNQLPPSTTYCGAQLPGTCATAFSSLWAHL